MRSAAEATEIGAWIDVEPRWRVRVWLVSASANAGFPSPADDYLAALAQMALTELWGVARRTAVRLEALGIRTPLALRDADPKFVREKLSVVMERMALELRGIPCIELEDVTPDRKSIMASRSFGRPVTTYVELSEAVSSYAARAAEKMRRQSLATAHISVFVHTNRFKPDDPQYYGSHAVQLLVATADTGRLLLAARDALKAVWKQGYSYKKAGVMLVDLCSAAGVQGDLWTERDNLRSKALMKAVDAINRDLGPRHRRLCGSRPAEGLAAEIRPEISPFHDLLARTSQGLGQWNRYGDSFIGFRTNLARRPI